MYARESLKQKLEELADAEEVELNIEEAELYGIQHADGEEQGDG